MINNSNTRLIDITANELLNSITEEFRQVLREEVCRMKAEMQQQPRYANSLKEFAEMIGVSESYVHQLKRNGVLGDAIIQLDRKTWVDIDIAMKNIKRHAKQLNADTTPTGRIKKDWTTISNELSSRIQ
jgi:hypothetical protein